MHIGISRTSDILEADFSFLLYAHGYWKPTSTSDILKANRSYQMNMYIGILAEYPTYWNST